MNRKLSILVILIQVIVFSCTRERAPSPEENAAPVPAYEEISLQAENAAQVQEEIIPQIEDSKQQYDDQEYYFTDIKLGSHSFSVSRYTPWRESSLHVSENYMVFRSTTFYTYRGNRRTDIDNEGYRRVEKYYITQEIVHNMLYINFYYTGDRLGMLGFDGPGPGQLRLLALYLDGYIFNMHGLGTEFQIEKESLRQDTLFLTSDARNTLDTPTEGSIEGFFRSASTMVNFLGPWIEGETGGIGERIRFTPHVTVRHGFSRPASSRVILLNGFVDFQRPYLFEYNNRARKIRIHWLNSGEYIDFELEDTPHFQMLYLGEKFQTEGFTFEIEVMDVYWGSRWGEREDNT